MRRFIWLSIVGLFLVCVLTVEIKADSNDWQENFFRANQAYKAGQYKKAVSGYKELIRQGVINGHIYYNLGNAYFRMNRFGRAILNYERAHILIPRDADINFNLGQALDRIKDVIPESGGYISMNFFQLKSLTITEILWAFACINLLFWTFLFIRLFSRSEWTYYFMVTFLALWLMAGASFCLKWYMTATDDRAVILKSEVDVLAGPDSKDTLLFQLHEGTIVHQERTEDGWKLIRISVKKRGWVKSGALELIQPASG